jgi:hypothetical protein
MQQSAFRQRPTKGSLFFPQGSVSALFGNGTPADYIGRHRFVRFKVAPLIIVATAGIGDHIGPVFILAQSFYGDILIWVAVHVEL